MRTEDFSHWLGKVPDLTLAQRQQAIECLSQEQPLAEVIAAITDPQLLCPHCHHPHCGHWGRAHGLPRYHCGACGKTFNAVTNTALAHLRHREPWTKYAQALIDGETVRKAARRCGVHMTTSFRWRHRFLALPAVAKPLHLRGIVEADETYFLESNKGKRHRPRPARQRGGMAAKRGLSAEQIPVLIVRDRSHTTTDAVLAKATTECIRTVLAPILDPDAVFRWCRDLPLLRCPEPYRPPTHQSQRRHSGPRQRLPHPERQCLRQPTQRLDGALLRRCDQRPPQLPRMAPLSGALRRSAHPWDLAWPSRREGEQSVGTNT